MGEIEGVYENSREPIDPDKQFKPKSRSIAAKQFRVQRKGQYAKGDDCKDGEPALDPEQLAIERH